jgi:hypothetical protein
MKRKVPTPGDTAFVVVRKDPLKPFNIALVELWLDFLDLFFCDPEFDGVVLVLVVPTRGVYTSPKCPCTFSVN